MVLEMAKSILRKVVEVNESLKKRLLLSNFVFKFSENSGTISCVRATCEQVVQAIQSTCFVF